jgi:multidrug efflux pump subunit AcrA (membrane-fusion protein)
MEIPMFSSKTLWAVPTTVLLGILAGCGSGQNESAKKAENAPAVAVSARGASTVKLPEVYEATGSVRARVTTVLSARTTGSILEVRVQSGDSVKAGQVIAVIDARDIETSRRQAEAGRREAQDARPEADSGVEAAQAQLDLAESSHRRMKSLFDDKSITAQEFDESQARLKTARANYEMARAKRHQLDARVHQADEAVAQTKLQVSFANVTAPFAGTVIERKAEPGMLASPGTPIVVIEQGGAYRLEASVDESRLAKIRPDTPVRVHLDAFGKELAAHVDEVVPALDPGSHSFIVKINLPGVAGMRSGVFGRALFEFGERETLAVPAGALVHDGQIDRLFVAEGNSARGRLVKAGTRSGDMVEILSGLSAGELVIDRPPQTLVDGARIEVRP